LLKIVKNCTLSQFPGTRTIKNDINPEERNICPNYPTCILVNPPYIPLDAGKKETYMSIYCHGGDTAWDSCKRYITKRALNFCPDFVLPDMPGTPDEIIDEFDKRMNVIKDSTKD